MSQYSVRARMRHHLLVFLLQYAGALHSALIIKENGVAHLLVVPSVQFDRVIVIPLLSPTGSDPQGLELLALLIRRVMVLRISQSPIGRGLFIRFGQTINGIMGVNVLLTEENTAITFDMFSFYNWLVAPLNRYY